MCTPPQSSAIYRMELLLVVLVSRILSSSCTVSYLFGEVYSHKRMWIRLASTAGRHFLVRATTFANITKANVYGFTARSSENHLLKTLLRASNDMSLSQTGWWVCAQKRQEINWKCPHNLFVDWEAETRRSTFWGWDFAKSNKYCWQNLSFQSEFIIFNLQAEHIPTVRLAL